MKNKIKNSKITKNVTEYKNKKDHIKYKLNFNCETKEIKLVKKNSKTQEYDLIRYNITNFYESLQALLKEQEYTNIDDVVSICNNNVKLWKKLETKQKEVLNKINNPYALTYPPILINEDNKDILHIYSKTYKEYVRVKRNLTELSGLKNAIKNNAEDKKEKKIENTINWIENNKITFVTNSNIIKFMKDEAELYKLNWNSKKQEIELLEYLPSQDRYKIIKAQNKYHTKKIIHKRLSAIYKAEQNKKSEKLTKTVMNINTETEELNNEIWKTFIESNYNEIDLISKIIKSNFIFKTTYNYNPETEKITKIIIKTCENGVKEIKENYKSKKQIQKEEFVKQKHLGKKIPNSRRERIISELLLNDITYKTDNLNIEDDSLEVVYYNDLTKKDYTIKTEKVNYDRVINHLQTRDRKRLDPTIFSLNYREYFYNYWEYLADHYIPIINNYYSVYGYFLDEENENKFISNNSYLNDKYGLKPSQNKEEHFIMLKTLLKNKIEEFIAFLKDLEKSYNCKHFTEIAKQILFMPFNYIFKQISYQDLSKLPILYGDQSNGKTENLKRLLTLYLMFKELQGGPSTLASLRNDFNNFTTIPTLIDEAKILLKGRTKQEGEQVQEMLKDARFNKEIKEVADLSKQGTNKTYKAFHTYLMTTNEANNIAEGLSRGILAYRFESEFTDKQVIEFEKKYPSYKTDFSIIGYCFSIIFEKYYNEFGAEGFRKYTRRPNELMNTIIEILEQNYDIDLTILKEANPFNDINTELYQDKVKECANKLQSDIYEHDLKYKEDKGLIALIEHYPEYEIFTPIITEDNTYFRVTKNNLNLLLRIKTNGKTVNLKKLLKHRNLPNIKEIQSMKEINRYKEGVYHYTGNKTTFNKMGINNKTYIITEEIMEKLFNYKK